MDISKTNQNDMESSLLAVEAILNYKFLNRKLLEDALTHSSLTGSSTFDRLEFLGDTALGTAVASFLYLEYPSLDEGALTDLRSVNVRNERLARVAVRHRFYRFIRHNFTGLEDSVNEFVLAVGEEETIELFGGAVKAPKVLADIVESIAAAVYIDCGFDLKAFWLVFRGILEPMVTWEILQEQPQPVTKLHRLCQKKKKQLRIKQWKEKSVNVASVYVDDELLVSVSSTQKDTARLNAAREALKILAEMDMEIDEVTTITFDVAENNEIISAKQKLFAICSSKKWPKPIYRLEKEEGPSHGRRYICCVEVEAEEAVLLMHGNERSRVKDAENSAASSMIYSLLDTGRVQRRVVSLPKEWEEMPID